MASRLVQETPYRDKVIYLYTNTAVLYSNLGQNDSSGFYVRKAVEYSREAGNLVDLSNSLGMYAGFLTDAKRFPEAEKAFHEALQASEQLGDPNDILSNMGALAEFYFQNKQFQKGIDISQQAIAMIKKYGVENKLPFIYQMMGENYKAAGDYKRAAEVLDTLVEVNDKRYEKISADALAEMQARFDVQKKENTIIRQQLDLVKKDYFIYSAILLLLLVVVSGWYVFNTYKKRQRHRAPWQWR
jgi:two-component system NarL family sensor kinase